MSERAWDREYGDLSEFYQEVYGQHVTGLYAAGSAGAVLLEAVQPAGDWSDAATPDLSIGWLASGSSGFSCDLGAGKFQGRQREGDAILIAPSAGSSIQMEGGHVCRMLTVPYDKLLALTGESGLPQVGDFGRLHEGLLRDPILLKLLEAFWREGSGGTPHGSLYADGLLLQLSAVLMRMAQVPARETVRGGLAPWQVRRLTNHMNERLAEDVTLDDLARIVGLSTFHVCRAFKVSTGAPPHRWRQQRRMERARELLEATGLPVMEVAAAVGYQDPSRFATAFRKAFGVNPSTFRGELRS